MYPTRMPFFMPWLFPDRVWHMRGKGRSKTASPQIWLTFDDGPHPQVTPWVLDQLAQFNCRATFFCIGANVVRYPMEYQNIQERGHRVGNHTMQHINGWKHDPKTYIQDVEQAARRIDSPLFRPPFGRMTTGQARKLRAQGYTLVMWDVLSGDFDPSRTGEECLRSLLRAVRPGSIVVFHDSQKAFDRLKVALPGLLRFMKEKSLGSGDPFLL